MIVSSQNTGFKKALVLFTKNPAAEFFHKRISSEINKTLQKVFFNQTIDIILNAKKNADFDLIISTDSLELKDRFNHKLIQCEIIKQNGKDFGDRFNNTYKGVFALGYREAVFIGNDSPDLTSELIAKSFSELETKSSIVIGSSFDGGFYLLGVKDYQKNLFDKIEWNSNKVLARLLINIRKNGKRIFYLPQLADIDDRKSFNFWLRTKTKTAKYFLSLIIYLLFANQKFIFFNPPFNKESYCSRRISQKSPPFLQLKF
ncbi:MAG: DUF2064 domain-containing protein [Ignavibacteriaceae bacterium]